MDFNSLLLLGILVVLVFGLGLVNIKKKNKRNQLFTTRITNQLSSLNARIDNIETAQHNNIETLTNVITTFSDKLDKLVTNMGNIEFDIERMKYSFDFSHIYKEITDTYTCILRQMKGFDTDMDVKFKNYMALKHNRINDKIKEFNNAGLKNITCEAIEIMADQERKKIKDVEAVKFLDTQFIRETTDHNIILLNEFFGEYCNKIVKKNLTNGQVSETFAKLAINYYKKSMLYTVDYYIKNYRHRFVNDNNNHKNIDPSNVVAGTDFISFNSLNDCNVTIEQKK